MQDERDMALRSYFNRLSPELEFRFNGAVECVVGWIHVERTDWRVMTNLFTHDSIAKTLTAHDKASTLYLVR